MPATEEPILSFQNDYEFICNYCHCPMPGYPIILGRSARLACSPCASAIVKLSICWVCGEMICRGDDCVSFGWCFWHRACYSCLLCGSRSLAGTSSSAAARACGKRSEVLRPPLCAVCDMETARDGDGNEGEEELVQACVDFVNSADGGIAKLRWERMDHCTTQTTEAMDNCTIQIDESETEMVLETNRNHDAKLESQREEPGYVVDAGEVIWVDIADPLNGAVFRPHPLKPVPTCMTRSVCKGT